MDHSLSPVLHHAAYRALGLQGWTYERIDCDAAMLPGLVDDSPGHRIGYSVTMPGKLAALAYATTVHKSEGSEYQAVVIPLTTQHFPMLQPNLVYTGVTRGKRLVVVVGQEKALSIAVRGQQTRRRWLKLAEWLRG